MSNTSAIGSGRSAVVVVKQYGGTGGNGYSGATGGAGASSTLTNAVSGVTTGGYMRLNQTATGGTGGYSSGGAAGAAGAATSNLTFNDTSNATQASTLNGTSTANGGAGGRSNGAGASGAAGGAAISSINLTGAHVVNATANASGGTGGDLSGTAVGNGVAGGTARATAAATTTSTTEAAHSYAYSTGGSGSAGSGAGNSGGAGGIASNTTATASGHSAYAVVTEVGGAGGRGNSSASGGTGQSITLTNAVSGAASAAGTLRLTQTATGGAGGYSTSGTAGVAGTATSNLSFNDNANATPALNLNGASTANGGAGGGSGNGNGASGGTAAATLSLTGSHNIGSTSSFAARATGGTGGSGGGTGNGGAGGAASATATATGTTTLSETTNALSYANGGTGGSSGTTAGNGGAGGAATGASATATEATATGARAYAYSRESGGSGGRAFGAGHVGGAGGAVSNTSAIASGRSAVAFVRQYGGTGGRGYSGASGGAGASSTLTNAVSGVTTGGYMHLTQTAIGGAGGYGSAGGGQGGAATSNFTFNDDTNAIQASSLTGTSTANGGAGGTGGAGAAGGAATSSITLTGLANVTATGNASGGSGSVGAAGGNASASASAIATGLSAAGIATSNVTATGGTGGTQGSAIGHSSATTANGQLALANSTATGSSGTTDTTAITQGGGVVTSVSAFASAQVGSSANTVSRANVTNVFGFNGQSNNSYAFATEVPSASFISSTLTSNNNLNTAFSGGTVFGEASQGASYSTTASGSREYRSTIAWTLDTTSLSGHLMAGLISDQSFGTGFTSLDFNFFENGTTIFDTGLLTTLSAANTFFTNHALDLGTFTSGAGQVVTFNFDLVASSSGTGFGDEFLLGTTGGNQPPVTTVPGPQTVQQAVVTPINGISVVDGDATSANETITVVLSDNADANVKLSASGTGVSGSNSNHLTITGTLAQVNSDLSTVMFQNNTAGTDSIDVATSDGRGGSDDHHIAVTVFSPLTGQVVLTTATEHVAVAAGTPVATFTDSNATDAAGGFTASINWGDGTTTAGTVSGSNGSFTVAAGTGGHTMRTRVPIRWIVTITRTSDSATTTATGNVAVAENDHLSGTGTTINGITNQPFNNVVVATFTDTDLVTPAGDFAATINWGDGTTTGGTVSGTGGAFQVTGTHTYTLPGHDTVTVTLTDDGSGTATATATTTANVAGGALASQAVLTAATEHVAVVAGTAVATFTDSNTTDAAGGFTASINWGDGTTTNGTVSGSSGSFTVAAGTGGHTYADEGTDPLSVTITRTSDSATTTATGNVAVAENDHLSGTGTTINGITNQPFNNVVVATFTDTDLVTPAGDFAATINWGDGTTTGGTVSGPGGAFSGDRHAYLYITGPRHRDGEPDGRRGWHGDSDRDHDCKRDRRGIGGPGCSDDGDGACGGCGRHGGCDVHGQQHHRCGGRLHGVDQLGRRHHDERHGERVERLVYGGGRYRRPYLCGRGYRSVERDHHAHVRQRDHDGDGQCGGWRARCADTARHDHQRGEQPGADQRDGGDLHRHRPGLAVFGLYRHHQLG